MATLNAYVSKHSRLFGADLHAVSPETLAHELTLSDSEWIKADPYYTLAGTAEVVITLRPREEAVRRQVAALRAQQHNIQAAAHAQFVAIERQISQLQAIECGEVSA